VSELVYRADCVVGAATVCQAALDHTVRWALDQVERFEPRRKTQSIFVRRHSRPAGSTVRVATQKMTDFEETSRTGTELQFVDLLNDSKGLGAPEGSNPCLQA
jgi:hypothetical protein